MSGLPLGLLFASMGGAFLAVLVDSGVKVCIIYLIAVLTAMMLRRSSAALRHLVWELAVLSFLLMPILSGAVPRWRVLPSWAGAPAIDGTGDRAADAPRPAEGADSDRRVDPGFQASAPREIVTDPASPIAPASPGRALARGSGFGLSPLLRLVFLAWMVGFALALLRIGWSGIVLRRLALSADPADIGPIVEEVRGIRRRLGVTRRVDVYLTPRRGIPMTWGFLRTQLLLPADAATWERPRLRAVLLHEFAHVKRFDISLHIVNQIVCAFYWFHPLVWLAAWRLRAESEHACDDWVLRCGVKASDYAEDLLSLLVPRSVPIAALAIVGQSELEGRVRAILDERTDRRSISARGLLVAAIVGVACPTALASLGASDQPTSKPTPPPASDPSATQPSRRPVERVTATCVDWGGKPVQGAEVHLFQYVGTAADGRFVHSGPFTSDERGKAVCSEAIVYDRGNHDRWFYARVPGRLVGVGRSAKWTNRAAFNIEGRVVMQASQTLEGRVTVPAGFDPTKVEVRTRSLYVNTGPGEFAYESFPREDHFPGLDTALPEVFNRRPDAKGRIRFGDVPVRGRLYLITIGDGLAEAQWANIKNREGRFDEPIEMTIEEESRVSGRVLTPDKVPAAGLKVTARLSSSGRRQNSYLSSFHAMTDDQGKFTVRGLPQTEFILSMQDPKGRRVFRPLDPLFVLPHQDPGLTLTLETGTRVSGRVLDPDLKPVEGAGIAAVADDRGGPGLSHDTTDGSGRFELRLPAGDAHLYFNGLPDGYAYPAPQVVKHLRIKPGQGDIQGLDFTLQRRSE